MLVLGLGLDLELELVLGLVLGLGLKLDLELVLGLVLTSGLVLPGSTKPLMTPNTLWSSRSTGTLLTSTVALTLPPSL